IDAANLTPEADQITLVAGATYTLTEVNNLWGGATGLPNIATGSDVTVFGSGAVIKRSSAAVTPAFRLFDVSEGASLTLKNVTRQGGRTAPGGGATGGAVQNRGTLTMDHVTARNNVAEGSPGAVIWGRYPAPGWSAWGGAVYSTGA